MPFFETRPAGGWPEGSINDMDYKLLGAFDVVCGAIIFISGFWSLWRVDRGLGYSCKPYGGNQRPPEVNSLSGVVCLVCGTMYVAKAFDFFDGGGTPFSLNWYWYLDYTITCPLIILDFCYSINLPYKLRYFFAVEVSLWSGVAAFVTPSNFRFGYFVLGCCWFIPMACFFVKHINERREVYPPACQLFLKMATWVILFVIAYNNTAICLSVIIAYKNNSPLQHRCSLDSGQHSLSSSSLVGWERVTSLNRGSSLFMEYWMCFVRASLAFL